MMFRFILCIFVLPMVHVGASQGKDGAKFLGSPAMDNFENNDAVEGGIHRKEAREEARRHAEREEPGLTYLFTLGETSRRPCIEYCDRYTKDHGEFEQCRMECQDCRKDCKTKAIEVGERFGCVIGCMEQSQKFSFESTEL